MSYLRKKIQNIAYRLYSMYHLLFLNEVDDSLAAITVLDDISLEWVESWENDPEEEEWVSAIQEDNQILHQGFGID